MRIVEKFLTLQGEGRYVGVPSYFVRTTGCNLRCAWENPDGTTTICDTPYTSWKPEAGNNIGADDILNELKVEDYKYCNHIVITGGEPTLQRDLKEVVDKLTEEGYKVTIETNGTRFVEFEDKEDVLLSISPKLQSSYAQEIGSMEAELHKRNNNFIDTINQYLDNDYDVQLKFVYNGKSDEKEIEGLMEKVHAFWTQIYLMPQGITTEQFKQKEKEMFGICMKHGWNYTPRLHIDVFGNIRGI